jgi:hypothetical protein
LKNNRPGRIDSLSFVRGDFSFAGNPEAALDGVENSAQFPKMED